ncbi:MAG TPA: CYTH domain-containing protein [Solirubrobacteraceae bacterium]|nr:CYTH domain-containing protein [Solirubrobacteraceae bacterium]
MTHVAIEIERKFLVAEVPGDLGRHPARTVRQGYLAVEDGGGEVRVRRIGDATVLTVKRGEGRTRVEEEVAIAPDAFDRLWPLTEGRRVEKVRHLVPAGDGLVLEVDVYEGDLAGLVVAEIEFPSEAAADAWAPPAWLGAEVTLDERYKNHSLASAGIPAR